jgi:hypothetical protein
LQFARDVPYFLLLPLEELHVGFANLPITEDL